jgi:hypothetical protein
VNEQPQAQLCFKNLSTDVTPDTLAEFLWMSIGLNVTGDAIRMGTPGTFSNMAFVHISREVLAEFFRRYLEGLTFNERTLQVEASHPRGERGGTKRKLWPPRDVTPKEFK